MRIFFAVFATVLAAFGYRSTAQVKSQVETCLMPVKGLWFCQKLEKLKTLDFGTNQKKACKAKCFFSQEEHDQAVKVMEESNVGQLHQSLVLKVSNWNIKLEHLSIFLSSE